MRKKAKRIQKRKPLTIKRIRQKKFLFFCLHYGFCQNDWCLTFCHPAHLRIGEICWKAKPLTPPFRYVENIGGTTVGQNRSVQLIKVGKRVLVVGVADSIQLLKEIDDEQECEAIVKQYEEAMESKTDLPKMMQKLTSQVKKHDQPTTSSFSANLKAQLAELKRPNQKSERKARNKMNEFIDLFNSSGAGILAHLSVFFIVNCIFSCTRHSYFNDLFYTDCDCSFVR